MANKVKNDRAMTSGSHFSGPMLSIINVMKQQKYGGFTGLVMYAGGSVVLFFALVFGGYLPAVGKGLQKVSEYVWQNIQRAFARMKHAFQPVICRVARIAAWANKTVISPLAELMVLTVKNVLVRPLYGFFRLLIAGSVGLWRLGRSLLAATLRLTIYQKLFKPLFVRPLVKVARLMTRVCVDFPAWMLTSLFCTAIIATVRGGERANHFVVHAAQVVQKTLMATMGQYKNHVNADARVADAKGSSIAVRTGNMQVVKEKDVRQPEVPKDGGATNNGLLSSKP